MTRRGPLVAEVLDSCKKVENQLVSFAAVGVSMDEEAVQEAYATCLAADKIIQVEPLSVTHTQQTQAPVESRLADQSSYIGFDDQYKNKAVTKIVCPSAQCFHKP